MGTKPEDILPDGDDHALLSGQKVRKGTIAAYLANIEVIENPTSTESEKTKAIDTMKDLASAIIAIGLHKHVIFKNSEAEKILLDASDL